MIRRTILPLLMALTIGAFMLVAALTNKPAEKPKIKRRTPELDANLQNLVPSTTTTIPPPVVTTTIVPAAPPLIKPQRVRVHRVATKSPVKRMRRAQPIRHRRSGSASLARIRQCESGNNYANKRNPRYRGAYQFSYSTWRSVGGSGDPANASPAEQDARASALMARSGPGQWPTCGRR